MTNNALNDSRSGLVDYGPRRTPFGFARHRDRDTDADRHSDCKNDGAAQDCEARQVERDGCANCQQ